MIYVYFEYGGITADLIAAFDNEDTYMACLPVLEAKAEKARATITEVYK